MAALQTIRKRGALLVGILGLALFCFIAGDLGRAFLDLTADGRNTVGEVYGKKLSIQDFQQQVEEQTDVYKFSLMMQGQEPTVSDETTEQIREQVWQQFVQNAVVEHECDELGLTVTDGEVQEALRQGTAQSLRLISGVFHNQTTGAFDLAQLQDFLKNYTKTLSQAQQAGSSEGIEQLQLIKKVWDFTERQLRQELLSNKYQMAFALSFVSNPVAAKAHYDEANVKKNVEVAALPYATIADKDITVSDEDLKKAYAQCKEQFYNVALTRDVKLLDVSVVASAADRAELQKKVEGFEQQLAQGGDAADIVRSSNSTVLYSNIAMSKNAFSRLADVTKQLDSMAVGSTKATYYNASDNTINTLKLIARTTAPDSILYRQIVATAATPEARKTQADSILKALQGGAAYADLAKRYGQGTDSVWLTSAQYETFGLNAENADYINHLVAISAGTASVISSEQGAAVVQVLETRKPVEKYNVAIVKCPLNFSSKTYNSEKARLEKFLSNNQSVEAIEKNAAKAGYMLYDLAGYTPTQNAIPQQIGGSGAKDCAKWIFDEAEAGDVSQLYECGRNGDHLIVALVKAKAKAGYAAWDDAQVKPYLEKIVKQQKKAERARALAKNAKTPADLQKVKGTIMATLTDQVFAGYPSVTGVNIPEPKLSGAIAKTAQGKTTGIVEGAAALYIARVTAQSKGSTAFDAAADQATVAQTIGQRAYQATFTYLTQRDSGMKDLRYKF